MIEKECKVESFRNDLIKFVKECYGEMAKFNILQITKKIIDKHIDKMVKDQEIKEKREKSEKEKEEQEEIGKKEMEEKERKEMEEKKKKKEASAIKKSDKENNQATKNVQPPITRNRKEAQSKRINKILDLQSSDRIILSDESLERNLDNLNLNELNHINNSETKSNKDDMLIEVSDHDDDLNSNSEKEIIHNKEVDIENNLNENENEIQIEEENK